MKNLISTLSILLMTTSSTLAHWNYDRLIVNGQLIGEPYQYIRKTNNSNSPLQNVNSTDMRCNSGGASGRNTQTYTVTAGDEVGFGIAQTFGHPGPQQVYLSRAPDTAASYDGSGDWVRIYSATTSNLPNATKGDDTNFWSTHKVHSFLFKLPAETPPGEYLLRAEGLALHAAHKWANAQFYVGCAQLKVEGKGEGVLEPTVKFPGAYTGREPGILIPVFWSFMTNYTAAGPKLWPEGTKELHVVKQLEGFGGD